mgnify:CR=1 FL=1
MMFRRAAVPLAEPDWEHCWLGGRRVMAIDGTTVDVPDSVVNDTYFGRAGVSKGERSAFPMARLVAVAECGTHAMVDATATAHGVLLRVAQARQGLARVEYAARQSAQDVGMASCGRRRRRQHLQEIERGAFAGQQRAVHVADAIDDATIGRQLVTGGNGNAHAGFQVARSGIMAGAVNLDDGGAIGGQGHQLPVHQRVVPIGAHCFKRTRPLRGDLQGSRVAVHLEHHRQRVPPDAVLPGLPPV